MRKRRKDLFKGSDTELLAMAKELDELHHDVGVPAMSEGISNMIDSVGRGARATSRRTFLLGAGAAAAGGAALLVVSGTPAVAGAATRSLSSVDTMRATAFPPAGLTGDLGVAAVAASLENLAVFAYSAGLSAATAGKLGAVPPAVAAFATTVKGQHQQHADAWNGVLKSHGKAAVTVTNPKLTPTVQADFAKVTDITGLAQLASDPRDDCSADLSGGDINAEVQGRDWAFLVDSAGGDAAHRHLVLRTWHVPRDADPFWYSPCVQPDVAGHLMQMHRRMKSAAVVLVLAGALLLAACGGSSGHRSASSGTSASSDHITISNFMYSPMSDVVAPGSTVSVTNTDEVTHTLSATGGQFNTGDISPKQTKTFTAPTKAGTYHYICDIHQFMMGTIVVK